MPLHHYLPQDRLRALALGRDLPEHAVGAVLLADITGFTVLAEQLRQRQGERRGVEVLSQTVNGVHEWLVDAVESQGGSVVGFAGDALTAWFDGEALPAAQAAVEAARAMQRAMAAGTTLSLKVVVTYGPVRRHAVGDPAIQRIDVLWGPAVARAEAAEALAGPGDVLVDRATAGLLGLQPADRRASDAAAAATVLVGDEAFLRLEADLSPARDAAATTAGSGAPVSRPEPPPAPSEVLPADRLRPWLLTCVQAREAEGPGLFATDLRPATALFLSFDMPAGDPEPGAPLLSSRVAQIQRLLQRHGGVLLELSLGDPTGVVYGNFGAAQVHEDDPARAVRAALAVRAAFAAQGLAVRAGISCGTFRVGGYGARRRQSFGAMGDDVNTASRLMDQAGPGEILISGRVRQAVGEAFDLAPRPPIAVRGKAEPLPVLAVLGTARRPTGRLREPRTDLPMVGRDAACQRVSAALSDVLAGQGRILVVAGEAGIGKSRLVAEAVRLAGRAGFVGHGSLDPADAASGAWRAWMPVWTSIFDVDPALPPRRQQRAAEAVLAARVPEHREAAPLLGPVLGLDWPDNAFTAALRPQDRKSLLETLLVDVLGSLARDAADDGMGLLLVLEDLHEADPLSLDLLLRVARSVESSPVLLLASHRPPDALSPPGLDRTLRALAAAPAGEAIELAGLEPGHAEPLIRARLAALYPERQAPVSPALIARLIERAQGHPFCLEELLAYLHDRGLDPGDAGALDAPDLPASLQALVLSRIDRLPSRLQQLMKVASVVGPVFRPSELRACLPALEAGDGLGAPLVELAGLDIVLPLSDEADGPQAFRHRLVRDVIHDSLAQAARVPLHAALVRHFEADPTGSVPAAVLAHHCTQAGMLEAACRHERRAAEQAMARFANDEALACLDRVLQSLPPGDRATRIEVLLQREGLWQLLSDHDARRRDLEAIDRLCRADEEAGQPASPGRRAQLAIRRARLAIDTGDPAEARAQAAAALAAIAADEASAAPDAERPAEARVEALLLDARAAFAAGLGREAMPRVEAALALARSRGFRRGEYNALSQGGLLHWQGGRFDEAQAWLERSLALIVEAGDIRRQLDVLNNLGVVAKARSRFDEALQHYASAQAIARRIGDRSGQAMLLNNMGGVCLDAGDLHRAGVVTTEAARLFAEIGEPAQEGMALLNRSEAHRGLGQAAPARELALRALERLQASGHRRGQAIVLDNLAQLAGDQGRPQEGLAHADAALGLARAIGARAIEAGVRLHQGRLLTASGAAHQALPVLDEAATLARELDATTTLQLAGAARAEALLADGYPPAQALQPLQALLTRVLPDEASSSAAHDADASRREGALPLWALEVLWRVLHAIDDRRAERVRALGLALLRERSERIPLASARQDYLAIPEHRRWLDPARDGPGRVAADGSTR